MCFGSMSRSCSTCSTRHTAHLNENPVISLIRRSHSGNEDGIVVMTLGTYTFLSVKRIFYNGQPTRNVHDHIN